MKRWTNTFLVGLHKCEMTYSQRDGLHAKWVPKLPEAKSFSAQEMDQYRAGRDSLLAEVGKEMGGQVLVVET
jgi:hypothetical protein